MKINNNSPTFSPAKSNEIPSKIKTFVFFLQIASVIALLVLWLTSDYIQNSKNLWVLFFYNFPSQFLIALVPHEPVVLYFGKFYSPITVAFVAVAGTLLTEIINYSVIKYVADLKLFKKARQSKIVNRTVEVYNKAPFIALLIAGFTPVPFYPFRFLVVLAHYPLIKYILAVFLSRTPRYIIIAFVGYAFKIPDYLLLALFIALFLTVNVPIVTNLIKKRIRKKQDAA